MKTETIELSNGAEVVLNETEPKDKLVSEDQKTIDPTEQSAFFLNQAHNQFKSLSYGLADRKKRAVARVLEAVLFEPLEKVELVGKHEEELFELCQTILYHKGIVMRYAIEKYKEKIKGEKVNEQV